MAILKTMLYTWTDDEVNRAWNMIAEEGNRRREYKHSVVKKNLSKGDMVTFEDNGGKYVTGEVVKVKYKKAIVEVNGTRWDVPFYLLTRV